MTRYAPSLLRFLLTLLSILLLVGASAAARAADIMMLYDHEGKLQVALGQAGNLYMFTSVDPCYSANDSGIGSYNFEKDWSIKSNGQTMARVSLGPTQTGKLILRGDLHENSTPLASHLFHVKNSANEVVMSITNQGDMYLKGEIKNGWWPPFYVAPYGDDASSGTRTAPFRTIMGARDHLRAGFGPNNAERTGNDPAPGSEMLHNVTVYLLPNTTGTAVTYMTPDTLPGCFRFDGTNSGNNARRIAYKAYPGETVVLSGGRTIPPGDFFLFEHLDDGNDVYAARLGGEHVFQENTSPGDNWTTNTSLWFRGLYVNGQRAVRARYPERATDAAYEPSQYATASVWAATNPIHLPDSVVSDAGIPTTFTWPSGAPPNQPEIALHGNCQETILRFDGLEPGDAGWHSPTIAQGNLYPYLDIPCDATPGPGTFNELLTASEKLAAYIGSGAQIDCHLENHYNFLSNPGEWYLSVDGACVPDRDGKLTAGVPYLFYIPFPDEILPAPVGSTGPPSIFPGTEIVYPRSSVVLQIKDEEDAPVRNLAFEGFVIEHANWGHSSPGYPDGFDCMQAYADPGSCVITWGGDSYGAAYQYAVWIERGENVTLKENVIQHAEGNGIGLERGSNHCSIVGNVVADIADCGIVAAGVRDLPPEGDGERDFANRIENNYVTKVGQSLPCSSLAILVANTAGTPTAPTTVAHNEICDVPATAIYLGLKGPYDDEFVHILNNNVHDIGTFSPDCGGIYATSMHDFQRSVDHDPGTDPFCEYAPRRWFDESRGYRGFPYDVGSEYAAWPGDFATTEVLTCSGFPYNTFLTGLKIEGNYIHDMTVVPRGDGGLLLALYLDTAPAGTSAHPIEITGNYWHNIDNGIDNSDMGELDVDGNVTTVTLEWGHPYADWVFPHAGSLVYDDGTLQCTITPLPYDGLFPHVNTLPYRIPYDHMFDQPQGLWQGLPVPRVCVQLWNDHANNANLHWQTATHWVNGIETGYWPTNSPESLLDRFHIRAHGNYHDIQPVHEEPTPVWRTVLDRDYLTTRSASTVVNNAGLQSQYQWIANRPELGQLRATMRPAPAARVARAVPAAGSPTHRTPRQPSIGRDWGSILRLLSGSRHGGNASSVPAKATAIPGTP